MALPSTSPRNLIDSARACAFRHFAPCTPDRAPLSFERLRPSMARIERDGPGGVRAIMVWVEGRSTAPAGASHRSSGSRLRGARGPSSRDASDGVPIGRPPAPPPRRNDVRSGPCASRVLWPRPTREAPRDGAELGFEEAIGMRPRLRGRSAQAVRRVCFGCLETRRTLRGGTERTALPAQRWSEAAFAARRVRRSARARRAFDRGRFGRRVSKGEGKAFEGTRA